MSESDQEDPLFGEGAGDGAGRVTLSEAAQATEHVLEGCRRELQLLRRHLRGREDGLRVGEVDSKESRNEDLPSPREQALRLASRLEACAGALRNASTPEE